MNDLISQLIDIKKELSNLSEQIYGASLMVNDMSPHFDFLRYLMRAVDGFHDKIAFQLKVSKEKSPPLNCS
jgi:hypothetical protein